MTLEGHGAGGGDTPTPPARTRWAEEAADEEDLILPPYVPGAGRSAARTPEGGAPADAAPAPPEPDAGDPWGGSVDLADLEPEAASRTVEPEPVGPASEPGASRDYPWDDAALPGGGELEPEHAAATADEDEFPFAAFDIEGRAYEPREVALEAEGAGARAGPPHRRTPEAEALAERLEHLAHVLRREGPAGVEREMDSRDRLTSLLAGVLAGYRARMEE
ncbi:MAG TPA: hypothetical protein VMM12_11110 [Longimicrobiales bacterium]|nr:hypothetical protein [Longimicrobiales bacterium]